MHMCLPVFDACFHWAEEYEVAKFLASCLRNFFHGVSVIVRGLAVQLLLVYECLSVGGVRKGRVLWDVSEQMRQVVDSRLGHVT